jgi:hypothetical protein
MKRRIKVQEMIAFFSVPYKKSFAFIFNIYIFKFREFERQTMPTNISSKDQVKLQLLLSRFIYNPCQTQVLATRACAAHSACLHAVYKYSATIIFCFFFVVETRNANSVLLHLYTKVYLAIIAFSFLFCIY